MKVCRTCGQKKPIESFWFREVDGGQKRRRNSCTFCSTRLEGGWTSAAFAAVHRFSKQEQYMIEKLAAKPTLSTALDSMLRRNPKRWHQILAAAMIARRKECNTE